MTLPSFVTKIVHFFSKKHTAEFHRDPYADWTRLLIASFIISLIIIAIDGYLFYKINKGELFTVTPAPVSHVPTFDRMLLQQENTMYDEQDKTFTSLESATSTAIDPTH